jgi:hypothetical protein
MTIKLPFRNAALALVLAGAYVSASAVTTDLGPVGTGAPTPFSGTVLSTGPFLDIFTFTLPANGGSGYSVLNFPLSIPSVGTFNTVFSSLVLVSNPDGIVGSPDDDVLNTVVSASGANSLSFTWGPTAGGAAYLSVSGITNGTLGGLYNGAISVSPIPEPGTWAMLGVGVGMIGFALRRRIR